MFCSKCGNKVDDNDVFCNKCGARVQLIGEIKDVDPKIVSKTYNKWVRAVSSVWGIIILFGTLYPGIPYAFELGSLFNIICEILLIPIGVSLISLGLFPEYINNKIQIKNKYSEIVVSIIIVSLVIVTIEPDFSGLSNIYSSKLQL
jgi:DNA-directed RNA polymerase subunit RPC12/RpoP